MKSVKIISIIIISFFISFCSACKTENTEDVHSKMLKKIDHSKNKLAPGCADLMIKIKKITEETDNYLLDCSAVKIIDYGPATQPIAEGENIFVEVSKSKIERKKLEAVSDDHVKVRIIKIPQAMGKNNNLRWEMLTIGQ